MQTTTAARLLSKLELEDIGFSGRLHLPRRRGRRRQGRCESGLELVAAKFTFASALEWLGHVASGLRQPSKEDGSGRLVGAGRDAGSSFAI